MPKLISFEGKQYSFPEDASDAEVSAALQNATASPSFATVVGAIPGEVSRQARSLGAGAMTLGADIVGSENLRQKAFQIKADVARESAAERPPNLTPIQEGLLQGGASAVTQVPAMIAGALAAPLLAPVATPAALAGAAFGLSTTLMGAQTGLSRYGDERMAGFNPGRSAMHALIDGLIEKYTEYLPLKELSKGNILWREARNFLVKEGLGEQIATLTQDINAKLSDQPDMTLGDYARDALITAIATPVAGGLQFGMAKGAQVAARALSGTPSPVTPPNAPPAPVAPPPVAAAPVAPVVPPAPPVPGTTGSDIITPEQAIPPEAPVAAPPESVPAQSQTSVPSEVPPQPTSIRVYLAGETEKNFEVTYDQNEAAALGPTTKYADIPFDELGQLQNQLPEAARLAYEGTTRFAIPKDAALAWKTPVQPTIAIPSKSTDETYTAGVTATEAPIVHAAPIVSPNTVPVQGDTQARAIVFPNAATAALWNYGSALTRYERTITPANTNKLNKLRDAAKAATGITSDAEVADTAQRYVYGTIITGLREAKAGTYNGPNLEVALKAQRAREEHISSQLATKVKNGEVALSADLPYGDAWVSTMQTYLQAWVKSFSPNMRVVILGVQEGNKNRARTWYESGVHYLYVPKQQNKPLALYVLAHEFGHMLVSEHFNDPRYAAIKDKLIREYTTLVTNTGGNAQDFVERFRSPIDMLAPGALRPGETLREFVNEVGIRGITIDEWLADQFVRYVHTNRSHLTIPEAKSFWKPLFEQLKEFFDKIVHKFMPTQTFKGWVESLRVQDSQMAATLSTAPPSPRVDLSVSHESYDQYEYTTRVLNRLPNKPTIKKVTIYGELGRPDVRKQEREMIGKILHDWPGESVDTQLFKERVLGEVIPLRLYESDTYADYGIGHLGYGPSWQVFPKTHLYEAKGVYFISTHFEEDPVNQYWAHSRGFSYYPGADPALAARQFGSFQRSWNIVELQSDLEQHDTKLTSAQELKVSTELMQVERAQALNIKIADLLQLNKRHEALDVVKTAMKEVPSEIIDYGYVLSLLHSNLDFVDSKQLSELDALVGTIGQTLVLHARELRAKLEVSKVGVPEALPNNWWELILRHETTWAARQDFPVVRLATADTVANVEGWTTELKQETMPPELKQRIMDFRFPPGLFGREGGGYNFSKSKGVPSGNIFLEGAAHGHAGGQPSMEVWPEDVLTNPQLKEGTANTEWIPIREPGDVMRASEAAYPYPSYRAAYDIPDDLRRDILNWAKQRESQAIGPDFEGTYRRYKNDITKFAKREFNAKEVTDEYGNTWLEWSTNEKLADAPIVYYNTEKAVAEANTEIAKQSGIPELPATFVRFQGFLQNILQLNQLAKILPDVVGLQRYRGAMRRLHALKAKLFEGPNQRIHDWHKLGRTMAKKVELALRDEMVGGEHWTALVQKDVMGHKVWVHEPTEEFAKYMNKRGISEEGAKLFLGVKNDNLSTLTAMEEVVRTHTQEFFAKSPLVLAQRLAAINDEFAQLRAVPFLHDARFGKYSVQVRSGHDGVVDGKEIKKGDLVYWEKFESKRLRNRRFEELKRELPGHNVSASYDSDLVSTMRGLPQSVTDAVIEVLNSHPDTALTPDQMNALQQIAFDQTAAGKFAKFLEKPKLHTAGASKDMRRAYAAYHWKTANAIAKLKYFNALTGAMAAVRKNAKDIRTAGGMSDSYDKLAEHLQKNFRYVMNPQHEFEQLRALVSMWYLWGSAKTAVMNLTSVPVLTYPYLWARFGNLQSQAALLRAMKDVATYWRDPSKISPDKQMVLAQFKADGTTDQSFASMLASVSDGGVAFEKIIPTFGEGESIDVARRMAWKISSMGMMPFRVIEQLNRQVTGLAAYDLMVAKTGKTLSMGDTEAYNFARDAVDYTQNEYGAWNRPSIMQGKQSIFMLFFSFVQNMSFMMFGGDKSWWRAMMVLGALAGLQGLPGMDNILDMFNWAIRKMTGQYVDLRNEAREVVRDIGMNPDVVMHGITHNWLGMGWDTSTSAGAGRIIPGTDAIFGIGKFEDRFLHATSEVGGPVGSLMLSFLQALADDNPNEFLRWDRALPPVLRNIEKAYSALTADAWVNSAGRPVAEDPTTPELMGQLLGFAPTRRTERTEELRAVKDIVEFYKERRTNLMEMMWNARRTHDAGVVADVRAAIAEFNAGVPSGHLKITSDEINASMKYREKVDRETSTMQSPQKRYRDIYRYIDELY